MEKFAAEKKLFHEINAVDQVFVDDHVIECLLVHEMIMLAFRISELIRATFYAYIFQLLTDIETTLDLTAFYNIFQWYA